MVDGDEFKQHELGREGGMREEASWQGKSKEAVSRYGGGQEKGSSI